MRFTTLLVLTTMLLCQSALADPPANAARPAIAPGTPIPGDYTRVIRDDHDRNTLYFTWSPAGMDWRNRLSRNWPEDHYRVCLFLGDNCESARLRQIFEFFPAARDIPPYRYRPAEHGLKADLVFQESRLNWSVAACVGKTGQCSRYSKPLPLDWQQKRLPVLLFPKDGATRDPMAKTMFHWEATADVDFYLLCMAKPGIACPTRMVPPSDDLFVMVLNNRQRRAYLDTLLNSALTKGPIENYRPARLHGQKMYWSVAICRNGKCVYQPSAHSINFDRGRANIFVRNMTRFDVNQLWLVGPGKEDRTLLTHDLNTYTLPRHLALAGGIYNDDYLSRVERHHMGDAEPDVAPYYHFEYVREMAGVGGPYYERSARSSVSFAPGIAHVPGYRVERETVFIVADGTYFEQILRGPNDRRYLYRPGGSFSKHPEVGQGPILLQALRDEGYEAY